MPRLHAPLVQGLHDLDRRHAAHVAVEVATARHGVDMGAEEDRLQRRIAALAPGGDVACGIDARLQAGGAHEGHGELAPRHVGIGIGGAADAAGEGPSCRAAEDAQVFQALAQALGIDQQRLIRVGVGGRIEVQGRCGGSRRDASQKRATCAWHVAGL